MQGTLYHPLSLQTSSKDSESLVFRRHDRLLVIGGFSPTQEDLRYQVAIVGRRNGSDTDELIGGGAIISEDLVLTVAQCFIDSDGNLIALNFAIIAGTRNLYRETGLRIVGDVIYIPNYLDGTSVNDIAIMKLQDTMKFDSRFAPQLRKIEVAMPFTSLAGNTACTSGYGVSQIKKLSFTTDDHPETGNLKFLEVNILSEHDCIKRYPNVFIDRQLCGNVLRTRLKIRGNCLKDIGNPLVINQKLIGLVSRIPPNCDDVNYATIYTKATSFLFFIELVLERNPMNNTFVHYNRPHFARPIHTTFLAN